MSKQSTLDGPAVRKLRGLIRALKDNNPQLAVQRASVLIGMLGGEDVVFALLPSPEARRKLRKYLSEASAALRQQSRE